MSTEYDLTKLVKVAGKALVGLTDEEWDAAPPMVRYEVVSAMLPVVQAILDEITTERNAPDQDDAWATFLAGF